MNEATNESDGSATSSAGVPSWRRRPSTITPTRVGERGGVLEVVRDEQRRDLESRQQLAAARSARRRVVCASSAASGSSSRRISGSRASARASATRCARRPRGSPGLASARWAIRNRSRYSSAACRRAYSTFCADGQVREERVVLEDESRRGVDRARRIDARGRRRTRSRRRAIRAAAGCTSPATERSTVVFPAPDGPTSATRPVDREAQLECRKTEAVRRGCRG